MNIVSVAILTILVVKNLKTLRVISQLNSVGPVVIIPGHMVLWKRESVGPVSGSKNMGKEGRWGTIVASWGH